MEGAVFILHIYSIFQLITFIKQNGLEPLTERFIVEKVGGFASSRQSLSKRIN